jgi:long-chain fatty acid transport protein
VVNNTAKYTQLIAYTGNATLAMAVTDKLLLGLGANLQYFQAKLSAELDASIPVDDPVLFLSGESKYSGDNIAFYPNLGAIYEFTDNTRVGLNYRMFVDQETKGNFVLELDVKERDSGVSDIGNYPAYSQFQFPDIVSLNFFHRPHEKVELLADVLYTHWSRMQAVSVNLFEPIIASHEPIDTDVDLRNTWRVGLGVNYYVTPEIKLRSGFAYDQSPVTDANRILQAPDADQFDVAIGLMYKPKAWGKTHIDFAYMHTFFKDGTFSQNNPVYRVIPIEQLDIVTAQGSFQNTANFVGLQLVHSM